jgi:predicted DNA-binding protein
MKDRSRLTVDMSPEEHMYLKMASAKLGMSMREFLLLAAFERMEEIEDEWLAERARETLTNIQEGKEKAISWKEMKKRLT